MKHDFWEKIIPTVMETVDEGYYARAPLCSEPRLSLKKAVQKASKAPPGGMALICEIKPASPSKGALLHARFNVEKLALEMKRGGACAISVLAEPKVFHGSLQNVCRAKKAGLPVLFKDFVYSNEQLLAAKKSGADCVLLIYALFEKMFAENADNAMREKIKIAHKLGLEALLETHSLAEFKAAKKLKPAPDLIGINNRSLEDLEINLNTTRNILAREKKGSFLVVSESGICSRKDVLLVQKAGASAALVGTSILRAKNPGKKISELLGRG